MLSICRMIRRMKKMAQQQKNGYLHDSPLLTVILKIYKTTARFTSKIVKTRMAKCLSIFCLTTTTTTMKTYVKSHHHHLSLYSSHFFCVSPLKNKMHAISFELPSHALFLNELNVLRCIAYLFVCFFVCI